MEWLITVVVAILTAALGFGGGILYRKKVAERAIGSAEEEATRLLNEAIRTGENRKKEMLVEAKDEIHKSRTEHDKEVKERRAELTKQERRLEQKESALDKKTEAFERKEEELNRRLANVAQTQAQAEEIRSQQLATTHNIDTINNSGTAYTSLPERHIEDMMQTKRNQCTFDTAIQERSCITGSLNQTAQCINAILNNRPYDKQNCTSDNTKHHADNRYKAGACEEGQCVRQLGFIELITQHCCNNTGNDAAEYTHL